MSDDSKTITREELERNDGSEGTATYVCYRGRVYDVSDSKLWNKGIHMNRHHAGRDLTAAFQEAPHSTEVLDRFREVGHMEGVQPQEEQAAGPELPALIRRFPMLQRHPHPMTVHFPIAFAMGAALFLLLRLVTGYTPFGATAFHCAGAGLAFTPVAIATGLYTWWLNYMLQRLPQVVKKLALTPVLFLLFLASFLWRLARPDILEAGGVPAVLYSAIILVLVPLVVLIGWYGATMTFPLPKD
jgi:predicted heme/steroid binding protein/uncharacterized membrane protein